MHGENWGIGGRPRSSNGIEREEMEIRSRLLQKEMNGRSGYMVYMERIQDNIFVGNLLIVSTTDQ